MIKKDKVKIIYLLIHIVLVFFHCSSNKDSNPLAIQKRTNTNPSDNDPVWQNLFNDNFNRSNTANGEIGDNWIVKSSSDTVIKILNQQIMLEFWYPANYPKAYYNNQINNKNISVSIKVMTPNYVATNIAGINLHCNTNFTQGYFLGFNDNLNQFGIFKITGSTFNSICTITYQSRTNYLYQIEVLYDYADLTVHLRDGNTYENLKKVSSYDDTYSSGYIGFYGGSRNKSLYIDEFKIMKLE